MENGLKNNVDILNKLESTAIINKNQRKSIKQKMLLHYVEED